MYAIDRVAAWKLAHPNEPLPKFPQKYGTTAWEVAYDLNILDPNSPTDTEFATCCPNMRKVECVCRIATKCEEHNHQTHVGRHD